MISDCNLPAPTNLQAVETGPSYAIMAWDAVPGAAGYLVSWYNASGAQINADTTLDTEFEVQGLEPGETYNFRVAAVCVSGEPSAIYAPVIVVPIITELVISSDNPLGNLVETCSQVLNPDAECTVDFNSSNMCIGKIKLLDLNQVYYFRVRYLNYEYKGSDFPKITIDLVKPKYYSETPVKQPKLFTEYGDSIGLIYQYGSARRLGYRFLEIRISKVEDTQYKINVLDILEEKDNIEFTLFSPNTFSKSEHSINSTSVIDENNSEIKKSESEKSNDTFDNIRIYSMDGLLLYEINQETSIIKLNTYLNTLPNGFYIISQIRKDSFSSRKILVTNN